jgi:uncharacterized protein (DUF1697 family)
MARLVEIGRALGLTDCRTYIQSGNLVFEATHEIAAGLETRMSNAIETECGFRPRVMIRSSGEWNDIIAANPFREDAAKLAKSIHVFLMEREPDKGAIAILAQRDFGSERWFLQNRTIYLHLPDGMGRSKLGRSIEHLLKIPMTARNWATMLALQALAKN